MAEPWLLCMKSTEILLNALTALISLHLYNAGFNAMMKLRSPDTYQNVETHENVPLWPSVYTGIAVISNRDTPRHYDINGCPPWYDLLVSCGTHKTAEFSIPKLEVTLSYSPQTVVAVCGKILSHEVVHWEGGERICMAHYMRNMVHDRLGVDQPSWCRHNIYRRKMHRGFLEGQHWT